MAEYQWTGGGLTGERYPADTLQTLLRVGRPLLVRYDLDGVGCALSRVELKQQWSWAKQRSN